MNNTMLIPNRERIFIRSCFESAPASASSERFSVSGKSSGNGWGRLHLHQLKQQLLHAALEQTTDAVLYKELCRSANMAADLAWDTAYPPLLFPCLFEEMVQAVWAGFQEVQSGKK